MKDVINWFEIPVADMDRAKTFYETIFATTIPVHPVQGFTMGFFPVQAGKVGGALVSGQGYIPGHAGALIYLNGNPDLSAVLGRVEGAGGKVLRPKFQVSEETGYVAFFEDSEGNKVALHSQN